MLDIIAHPIGPPYPLSIRQHPDKMMAGDIHPLPQVEPMGSEALDAGVEMELVALVLFGIID
jgi:hypothetical protein